MGRRKRQLDRLRAENVALTARLALLDPSPHNDARVRQATDLANHWWQEGLAAQARIRELEAKVRELEAQVEHYMGETKAIKGVAERLERAEHTIAGLDWDLNEHYRNHQPMPTVPPTRVTVHEYGNSMLQTEKAADPWIDWT